MTPIYVYPVGVTSRRDVRVEIGKDMDCKQRMLVTSRRDVRVEIVVGGAAAVIKKVTSRRDVRVEMISS